MAYLRVLPRDLFNEAKLLKCLGQLALIFHDHEGQFPNVELRHRGARYGFRIDQNSDDDGSLYCVNLNLYLIKRRKRKIKLSSVYNSKSPYPLLFDVQFGKRVVSGDVFNDDGTFSTEFLDLIKSPELSDEGD